MDGLNARQESQMNGRRKESTSDEAEKEILSE